MSSTQKKFAQIKFPRGKLISSVECVCADGSRTAPLIIFKKKEDDDVSPAWVPDNEDKILKN